MLSDVIFFTFFSAFNFPLSSSHFANSEPSMGGGGENIQKQQRQESCLTLHPFPSHGAPFPACSVFDL